jgi:quercetin dioxygenase-like cupin family protein
VSVIPAPAAPTHELPGVRFTTLATPSTGSAETSVWQVELAPHADAQPHRVTREEIFVGIAGRAVATLDGVPHRVGAGDALVVRPGVDFALAVDGDAPFRALVCQPVGGGAVLPGGDPFTPPWAL